MIQRYILYNTISTSRPLGARAQCDFLPVLRMSKVQSEHWVNAAGMTCLQTSERGVPRGLVRFSTNLSERPVPPGLVQFKRTSPNAASPQDLSFFFKSRFQNVASPEQQCYPHPQMSHRVRENRARACPAMGRWLSQGPLALREPAKSFPTWDLSLISIQVSLDLSFFSEADSRTSRPPSSSVTHSRK